MKIERLKRKVIIYIEKNDDRQSIDEMNISSECKSKIEIESEDRVNLKNLFYSHYMFYFSSPLLNENLRRKKLSHPKASKKIQIHTLNK